MNVKFKFQTGSLKLMPLVEPEVCQMAKKVSKYHFSCVNVFQ